MDIILDVGLLKSARAIELERSEFDGHRVFAVAPPDTPDGNGLARKKDRRPVLEPHRPPQSGLQ